MGFRIQAFRGLGFSGVWGFRTDDGLLHLGPSGCIFGVAGKHV